MRQLNIGGMYASVDDIGIPWHRGIGNDSRKIYDRRSRVVCETHSASDSTLIVTAVNKFCEARDDVTTDQT